MLTFVRLLFIWTVLLCFIKSAELLSDFEYGENQFIRQLAERVSVLESRDKTQQDEINELRQQVIDQREEILVLKSTIAEKDQQPTKCECANESIERIQPDDTEVLKKEVASQQEEISAFKRLVTRKDQQLWKRFRTIYRRFKPAPALPVDTRKTESGSRIRRAQIVDPAVVFSAGLTHSVLHAGQNQNTVFEHVETNIGNGYNGNNGVFVAPISGTYVFHTSVLAYNDREIWCLIGCKQCKKGNCICSRNR